MPKFRKKPVVIEAMQVTANVDETVQRWINDGGGNSYHDEDERLLIRTLEGDMHAAVGDWVIRGVKGEFYPCKPDIFAATYEAVDA